METAFTRLVGFLMPLLDRACLRVAARKARVVEFFYGAPDAEIVREARAHGARASWQVGSLDEALAAERAVVARLGTRLVACAESGAHPEYVTALLAAPGRSAASIARSISS